MATNPKAAKEALSSDKPVPAETSSTRREIAGNFSYSNTPNRFKETLDALIKAERPDKFNRDFIETVLGVKGGTVSGFPPILKRLGLLSQDNSPTELYGQFQSDSGRSEAAYQALKNGFAELFKRNAHVHKADDAKIKDYLVQITGRKKEDAAVSAILGTFNAVTSDVQGFIPEAVHETPPKPLTGVGIPAGVGLSYHINIVIPETSDLAVLNAIFRSLRDNLLRD